MTLTKLLIHQKDYFRDKSHRQIITFHCLIVHNLNKAHNPMQYMDVNKLVVAISTNHKLIVYNS